MRTLPLRVGVNCFPLAAHLGGIRHYFINLFRVLLAAEDAPEFVFFWYPHNASELAQLPDGRWRRGAVALQRQEDVARHVGRMDVYFCPLSALYPRPLPLPTVVTQPDAQEVFHPEFFTAHDLYVRDLHYAASVRMADRVITVSEFSKKAFVERHRVNPRRVLVAHHSVSPVFRTRESWRPPAAELPPRFVLYPANLWRHKGHEHLLQAVRWLREVRGVDVHAVFTGCRDPTAADYPLAARASALKVADLVHDLGFVAVEELAYLYGRASMLVFPSLFEGFGLPLVEAMTAGCPIAALRRTAIPEVVGAAARLYDEPTPEALGRAIADLLAGDGLRERLIDEGHARAQRFTDAAMAAVHHAAFREAARAYSRTRYEWQRWVYQPYHRTGVEARRILRSIRPSAAAASAT